jgi:uncharacterized protein YndB with AHSA1/START domain
MTDPSDAVSIERTFDAPLDLIWQMWTDPAHVAVWYGPEGASVEVVRMEVRVGGGRLVAMHVETPGGRRDMWFTGEFREVVEGKRLVYTESMGDEHGKVLTPAELGLPESHPTTTEVRVELEETAGHTTMVMTHVGIPADSPGAAGWTMAFDKLARHLEHQGGGLTRPRRASRKETGR